VAAATDKPIRVVEGGRIIGLVDRVQILEAMAGRDPADDAAAAEPSGASGRRPARIRVEPVQDPTEGTAELLAGSAVDPGASSSKRR
jgi:hypothetical protein